MYPQLDRILKILERLNPALGAKLESKNVLLTQRLPYNIVQNSSTGIKYTRSQAFDDLRFYIYIFLYTVTFRYLYFKHKFFDSPV